MAALEEQQPSWPFSESEIAGRIRVHHWFTTPLGPTKGWPGSLRADLDLVLAMAGPAITLWGRTQVRLYNNATSALVHGAGRWSGCCQAVAILGMPFKYNAARRHCIPKARRQVQNWSTYEASLNRRGDLMLWLDEDTLALHRCCGG